MARHFRRYRPTKREKLSSFLLTLSGLDIPESGELSAGVIRRIILCLDMGATMTDISEIIGRNPSEIERELERYGNGYI